MVQIIGWLGCVMLAVKLLEIMANPNMHDENGKMTPAANAALWTGWPAVIGFALWLAAQGGAFNTERASTFSEADLRKLEAETACMEAAPDLETMLDCQGT